MSAKITPKFSGYKDDSEYIVQCETCQEVFLKITLRELKERVDYNEQTGDWNHSTWTPKKQKWYIQAGKHWVETLLLTKGETWKIHDTMHKIKIFMVHMDGAVLKADLVFDLSEDWWQGLLKEPKTSQSKEAMLKELEYLEKTAI